MEAEAQFKEQLLFQMALLKRLESIEAKLEKRIAFLPAAQAVALYREHLQRGVNRRGRHFTADSVKNFSWFLEKFEEYFGEQNVADITADDCNAFLLKYWRNTASGTYRQRTRQLRIFFNFCIQYLKRSGNPAFHNPCELLDPVEHHINPPSWIPVELMRHFLHTAPRQHWLSFSLMATAGLRIADVVNLRFMDVQGRILYLRAHGNYSPKSGKREEIATIPMTVAERIQNLQYLPRPEQNIIQTSERAIFKAVQSHGKRFGLDINNHYLRKWCASYWERKGEYGMVNFVLRHSASQLRDRYVAPLSIDEVLQKQNILDEELFNFYSSSK